MIYDKARELGVLIMETDYAKNLAQAKARFDANSEAKARFDAYTQENDKYLVDLRAKKLTPQEIAQTRRKIDQMLETLEAEADLVALLDAEQTFNDYVNSVMQLLKFTIAGDGCNSGGSCGGR